ncbi:hypothetical protein HYPSUDRAFT_208860 [Hypholoma sublateritium FD-334 SS-4]|uniref:Uncharacterized protein n=1 Tax=Hypholoma sublateritium (strain FD-334 SS-4) TaxID=945553 RepID=A0A0D2LTW3_HYPSF|nr:hypothetical protein HYPSUDRAFT_208860 [Hypholoma sublateritium FD-334 SS-4]
MPAPCHLSCGRSTHTVHISARRRAQPAACPAIHNRSRAAHGPFSWILAPTAVAWLRSAARAPSFRAMRIPPGPYRHRSYLASQWRKHSVDQTSSAGDVFTGARAASVSVCRRLRWLPHSAMSVSRRIGARVPVRLDNMSTTCGATTAWIGIDIP